MPLLFFWILFLVSCAAPSSTRVPEWRRGAGAENPAKANPLESEGGEIPPYSDSKILDALPSVEFEWPVKDPFVTDYFGWRKKKLHEGIDLRAWTGTPILASASGEVIYVDRRVKYYGKMIVIDHGGGWSTLYAHLSKYNVKVGTFVTAGQRIGLSGRTGRVSGPHLHFEIRKGADPVDPMLFLPSLN